MQPNRRDLLIQALLIVSSVMWIGLAWAAPYLRSTDHWAAGLVYGFFQPVCHQMPERSFAWMGQPVAVCHRCMAIYCGLAAGLLIMPRWRWAARHFGRRPKLLIVGAALMAVDVFLVSNTPATRFVSGFVAAFPAGLFVYQAAVEILSGRLKVFGSSGTVR